MIYRDKAKLGELMIEASVLTESQLQNALGHQKKSGQKLGEAIVELKILSRDEITGILAKQLKIEKVNLDETEPDLNLISLIPESCARKYRLIPLRKENGKVIVAMADPMDIFALDEIALKLSCGVTPAIGLDNQIMDAIDKHYGVTSLIHEAVRSIRTADFYRSDDDARRVEITQVASEAAPIAKLVETMITEAVLDRASDIHIEPDEDVVNVRTRIDGVLFPGAALPNELRSSVISRIKVISHMDIAETRIPQDGRFKLSVGGKDKDVEFRVSSFPTIYGENIVVRILNTDTMLKSLSDTGLKGRSLLKAQNLFRAPYGITVVTGPTGSGKTSTLYAALNLLNDVGKNIITIEDPVEYRLPGVRQSQVNKKAGLDFATSMRSILRQDPDIIMVGEIRDYETAEIAVQAAMTGHLVLSTLHTNDAPGAVARLIDLGIEPYLISSGLSGVIAQRLVRRICLNCKQPIERERAQEFFSGMKENTKIYEGAGCIYCKKSGFWGRTGIFEVIVMDDPLRSLVNGRAASSEILRHAVSHQNMKTIRQDGIDKVFKGITTIGEVNRVTSDY
ncbi:MAG: hypothetical protein IEMM0002_1217 [bacterium]|nr:MAG: hypothetical protein IEMM0002_1217 [bacterium]